MESSDTTHMGQMVEPSRSFLNIPAEIRNKVYGYVYDEITIHCSYKMDLQSLLSEYGVPHTNHVTPNTLSLLLACRQTYVEAKPYLDSASITVTGEFGGRLHRRSFPHVLHRISEITFHHREETLLSGLENGLLGHIVDQLRKPDVALDDGEMGFRAPELEPGHGIEVNGKMVHDLLAFLISEDFRARNSPETIGDSAKRTDSLIKDRDLTMSTVYKFFVRGEFEASSVMKMPAMVVFEEEAEVVITWDKNGIRLGNVPDFTSCQWWNVIKEKAKNKEIKNCGPRELRVLLEDLAPTESGILQFVDWFIVRWGSLERDIIATRRCLNRVTPSRALLLTSRELHNEAKSYSDEATIVVSGHVDGSAGPRFLPHVLERITKLTVHGSMLEDPAWMHQKRIFNYGFLRAARCPNLKTIHLQIPPRSMTDHRVRNQMLELQLRPGTSDEQYRKLKRVPTIEWLRDFPFRTNGFNTHLQAMATESIIRQHDWTIKIPFQLYLRGIDPVARHFISGRSGLLFEERFTVMVVRDKNGARIEDLPDFREKAWWKDPMGWTEYAATSDGKKKFVIQISDDWAAGGAADWYRKAWKASKPGHTYGTGRADLEAFRNSLSRFQREDYDQI
ncbi:hypothetical protein H2200_002501 [Cladophialophora chaetospira]|uniref:Uncharacterized protein n=1 Tax=Cladophialophora chaetospira TaxID=386627 RepID=A0AA38XIZ4_9EURO|nr:hypothetical protein H2200_002501 [Cladophialophora chaetospira]